MSFTNNGIEQTIRIYLKFIATVDLDTQMDRALIFIKLVIILLWPNNTEAETTMGTHKKQIEVKPIIITGQTAWLILRVCMGSTPLACLYIPEESNFEGECNYQPARLVAFIILLSCIMQNLKFDGAFNIILADDIKLHTYSNTLSPP